MNRINKHLILLLLASIIISSSFIIYMPTLNSGFIWDDVQLLSHPFKVGKNPYSFFFGGGIYYRPFLRLSMAIDYNFWHLDPMGYHVTNILLHTINSLLVFLLGFYLLKNQSVAIENPRGEEESSHKTLFFSFIAAMLFALHPIHIESVAWISGRTDILSTLFFLLAFLSYLIYEREGRGVALVLSSVFFLFSLFSKENGIAFIGVVFVYGIITKMPKKKVFLSLMALSAVFVVYLILRHGGGVKEFTAVPGSKEAFFSSGITIKNFFKILSLGAGYYFEKLLLPFNLNLMPPFPEKSLYFLVFFLPFVIGGILYFAGKRLEFFLLMWVIVTLLPSLSILFSKMANPLGERYLYLPSVGFSILISSVFANFKNKKVFLIAIFAIFLVFTLTTHERIKVWKDDTTLWEDTVKKNPRSLLARINYGSSLLRTGSPKDAKDELIIALKMKDISFDDVSTILYLLGEGELEGKNYVKAEEYFINASKADPQNVAVYNGLGYLYFQMSGLSEFTDEKKKEFLERAIVSYEYALKLSPNFLKPMYYLALCYLKQGDLENAERYFKSVIELDPERDLSANAVKFLMLIQITKIRH